MNTTKLFQLNLIVTFEIQKKRWNGCKWKPDGKKIYINEMKIRKGKSGMEDKI